jgi:hypothetical protein
VASFTLAAYRDLPVATGIRIPNNGAEPCVRADATGVGVR